jgi:uncharacterized membrane protein
MLRREQGRGYLVPVMAADTSCRGTHSSADGPLSRPWVAEFGLDRCRHNDRTGCTDYHRTVHEERIVQKNVRATSDPLDGAQKMTLDSSRVGVRRPFYPLLVAFAVSCLLGTLATDIAYWLTADIMWADFSDWLVTTGVIVGYLTIVVALIEAFAIRSTRLRRRNWAQAIGLVVALVLATLDMLVHTRDAWTSVVPWGVVLSAVVVAVTCVSAWMTRETYDPAGAEVRV